MNTYTVLVTMTSGRTYTAYIDEVDLDDLQERETGFFSLDLVGCERVVNVKLAHVESYEVIS